MRHFLLVLILLVSRACCDGLPGQVGTVSAVYDLLERVIPGSSSNFSLSLGATCPGAEKCFITSNTPEGIKIVGSTASELSFAIGEYFRNECNITTTWPRSGGTVRFDPPSVFPPISEVTRSRTVPWTFAWNVVTFSYTFAFYDWSDWTVLIDWLALWGVNNVLSLTGQEEVAYQVFSDFGFSDTDIRTWFNGPALLAWSRSQNHQGKNILGPLPRSFMKNQYELQKSILARSRALGMTSQLPGYFGNMPPSGKQLFPNANITLDETNTTAFVYGTDPLYAKIADAWMKKLVDSYGTDHWYSVDGWLNGNEGHWLGAASPVETISASLEAVSVPQVNLESVVADEEFIRLGTAAFTGLNRTDPDAIWVYQSYNFHHTINESASALRGFTEAVPQGQMVIIDMAPYGEGDFFSYNGYWGQKFIWTSIHDFGGNDGIKGNLSHLAEIPFAALESTYPAISNGVIGVGITPEGIDQNPIYYEFLLGQGWRKNRINPSEWAIDRAHRAYGLKERVPAVVDAWNLLLKSGYSYDESVVDKTGVTGRRAVGDPEYNMCDMIAAWEKILSYAETVDHLLPPLSYDLINVGREVVAQTTTSYFSELLKEWKKPSPDHAAIQKNGLELISVLEDLDDLLATNSNFLLGTWLEKARKLAGNTTDCVGFSSCADFYEYNSRAQLTTWHPVLKVENTYIMPTGPVDYAGKHWSGLIKGYYVRRLLLSINETVGWDEASALIGYHWPRSNISYELTTRGNPVTVSRSLYTKYNKDYSNCQ